MERRLPSVMRNPKRSIKSSSRELASVLANGNANLLAGEGHLSILLEHIDAIFQDIRQHHP